MSGCRPTIVRRQVGDVGPLVAVLRDRVAERGGLEGGAEEVDLVAAVVEVELARHRSRPPPRSTRPMASPSTAHRVCTEVQRAGRVGRDELDVDRLARRGRRSEPYADPAATMSAATWPCAPASTVTLRKPGPATSTSRDAVGGAEPLGDEVGEGAGVGPGLLGQLERHVGGVVAVTLLPGSLHRDLGRHAVGQRDRAVGHEGLQRVDDGLGELIGIHRASLSAGPGAGRTGFTPWPADAPRVLP